MSRERDSADRPTGLQIAKQFLRQLRESGTLYSLFLAAFGLALGIFSTLSKGADYEQFTWVASVVGALLAALAALRLKK